MLSVEKLIQRIRVVVYQPQQLSQREMAELCREYAELCDRVNERLLQCVLYMRKGYRSEAVRLCSLDHNLLEVLTQLNFAEAAEWNGICQEMGISPPPLRFDLAEEINGVFIRFDETKEFTAKLRRQYVLRRPVELRETTLRALEALEPTNHVWQENLHACEQEKQGRMH